jgi:hypothetical protein
MLLRPTRLFAWGCLVALGLYSLAVYDALPATMPRQLDAGGTVTSTGSKSPMSWAGLPLVAFACLLLTDIIATKLPRRPSLFNFPGKERFLQLPESYRGPAIARLQRVMDMVGAITVLVMFGAQWLMAHVAQGGSGSAGTVALIVGPSLLMPLVFVMVQGVNDEVDAAMRRWESERR